jgi:ATP-dependent 26S proteasome regulatory subunit
MTFQNSVDLCPAQRRAHEWFLQSLPIGNIFHFWADTGRGRTTVLLELHRKLGGALVTIKDFVEAIRDRHPLALEDSLYQVLLDALQKHDHVIVDDLHLATAVMAGCGPYPRTGLIDAPMTVLAAYAVQTGKKLILGTGGGLVEPLNERCLAFGIESFAPEDYRHLCTLFLGEGIAAKLDFEKVHRFAPNLNAHQLKNACAWCGRREMLTTERFIDYLRSQELTSNVELGEVTNVELAHLEGVDDVIRSLEANVALPFENDELAHELGLKPKRGVLLVGPPGTGKTTVGRALAHRLKGKFFLIDGTFISGTDRFYGMVHRTFEYAKANAPAVIFIDDSDVIFESGQEHGLYRYLLTMLDGLESKSAARVCVMMTAMDVGNLPPALVRSGRIELWLEMRLPDETARGKILSRQIAAMPAPLCEAEIARLVQCTGEFTGADLKRMAEDAKILFAFDRASGAAPTPATDYFLTAAATVRASKAKYAHAEARTSATRPSRPVWFNPDAHGDFEIVEEAEVDLET